MWKRLSDLFRVCAMFGFVPSVKTVWRVARGTERDA